MRLCFLSLAGWPPICPSPPLDLICNTKQLDKMTPGTPCPYFGETNHGENRGIEEAKESFFVHPLTALLLSTY